MLVFHGPQFPFLPNGVTIVLCKAGGRVQCTAQLHRFFTVLVLPGTQFSSPGEVEDDDLIGLCVLLTHSGKFRPGEDSFLVSGTFRDSRFLAFTGLLNAMLGVMAGISCRLDAV